MFKSIKNYFWPKKPSVVFVPLTREEQSPMIGQPIWTILDLMKAEKERFKVSEVGNTLILRDNVNNFAVQFTINYVDGVGRSGRPQKLRETRSDMPWMNYHEVNMLHGATVNMLVDVRQAHNTELRNQVIEQYRS